MMALFGYVWFLLGIIFAIAGKDFLEVAACFFLFLVAEGVYDLSVMREELEDWEEDV